MQYLSFSSVASSSSTSSEPGRLPAGDEVGWGAGEDDGALPPRIAGVLEVREEGVVEWAGTVADVGVAVAVGLLASVVGSTLRFLLGGFLTVDAVPFFVRLDALGGGRFLLAGALGLDSATMVGTEGEDCLRAPLVRRPCSFLRASTAFRLSSSNFGACAGVFSRGVAEGSVLMWAAGERAAVLSASDVCFGSTNAGDGCRIRSVMGALRVFEDSRFVGFPASEGLRSLAFVDDNGGLTALDVDCP